MFRFVVVTRLQVTGRHESSSGLESGGKLLQIRLRRRLGSRRRQQRRQRQHSAASRRRTGAAAGNVRLRRRLWFLVSFIGGFTGAKEAVPPPNLAPKRSRRGHAAPPECKTRSSAIAEGPRDASCQLKSCQLPRNSAETTYTTSLDQIDGMKLKI